MKRFRNLKEKLINSKRDSQRLDDNIVDCLKDNQPRNRIHSASIKHNTYADISSITQENYKISCNEQYNCKTISFVHADSAFNKKKQNKDFSNIATIKKIKSKDTFGMVLELMQELNSLQQTSVKSQEMECIIREKLSDVKRLICSIQNQSSRSFMDFYRQQENYRSKMSPSSFDSQRSDQKYQAPTQRGVYQLSDSRVQEQKVQIEESVEVKYRRFQQKWQSMQEQEDSNDTFCQQLQESATSECNIVHLYSYSKEVCLESPLSKISQRQSQYMSPESKIDSKNSEQQSIQYKKICYLLETTQKKSLKPQIEVSQFIEHSASTQSHNRNKSHSQLGQMIQWLQKKYSRTIKLDNQNSARLKNALRENKIKIRNK